MFLSVGVLFVAVWLGVGLSLMLGLFVFVCVLCLGFWFYVVLVVWCFGVVCDALFCVCVSLAC